MGRCKRANKGGQAREGSDVRLAALAQETNVATLEIEAACAGLQLRCKASQPSKAASLDLPSPADTTPPGGREMSARDEQSQKASQSTSDSVEGAERTDVRLGHIPKALAPTVVSRGGRVMLSREGQAQKAQ